MTDEQIRLYAIARTAAPLGTRIRTIAEPVAGGEGTLYTIEMKTPYESGPERWFAIHSDTLRNLVSVDGVLASELKRVFA